MPFRHLILMILGLAVVLAVGISSLVLLPRQVSRAEAVVVNDTRHELVRLQGMMELVVRMGSEEHLQSAFAATGSLPGLKRALMLDSKNMVMASTRLAEVGRPLSELGELPLPGLRREALSTRSARVALQDHLVTGYVSVCGLNLRGLRNEDCGTVFLQVDTLLERHQTASLQSEQLFVFGSAAAMTAVLIFIVLNDSFAKRLERIHGAISRFKAGERDVRLGMTGQDELTEVGNTLDQLFDTIATSEREMRKLSRAVHQSPAAITIVDADGRLEYMNPVAQLQAPRKCGGALGEILPVLDGKADMEAARMLARAITGGEEWHGELCWGSASAQQADHRSLWTRAAIFPLRDDSGRITHYLIEEENISELKLQDLTRQGLEKQLRHTQKMETIGRLAGGVAHDFNNILTPIGGYAQMMLDSLAEDDPAAATLRRRADRILAGVNRARDLVGQLLVVSRKGEQETVPMDPARPVREAVQLVRASAPSVQFDLQIDDKVATVMGDPSRLHQVAMNLCTNAIQAIGDQQGHVSVRLANDRGPDGPEVRLSVEDDGPGMPPEVVERIFEPFFTTKKTEGGSGLGLSIVDGIVAQLGGRVSCYSEVGLGTVFHVRLPAADRSALPAAEELPPAAGGSERLMLVDDEVDNLEALQEYLAGAGYGITMFGDPAVALAALRSDPRGFDLLITDFAMPGFTGAQLAQEAKALRPDLPVVMISGFSSRVTKQNKDQFGIDRFLAKPLDFPTLRRTVRDLLDEAHARRAPAETS